MHAVERQQLPLRIALLTSSAPVPVAAHRHWQWLRARRTVRPHGPLDDEEWVGSGDNGPRSEGNDLRSGKDLRWQPCGCACGLAMIGVASATNAAMGGSLGGNK